MRRSYRALMVTALLVVSGAANAQWTKGPVIFGGDDSEEHYGGAAQYYQREAFNFYGQYVSNGEAIAVCIGCNGSGSQANFAFEDSFDASDLPPVWTRTIITSTTEIEKFFTNDVTATVKIQDTGIIYLPSSDGQVSGGIQQMSGGALKPARQRRPKPSQ